MCNIYTHSKSKHILINSFTYPYYNIIYSIIYIGIYKLILQYSIYTNTYISPLHLYSTSFSNRLIRMSHNSDLLFKHLKWT